MAMVNDVQARIVADAHARNRGTSVAYLDESYLAPAVDVGGPATYFYLMTAYVVPCSDLDDMRDDIRELVGGTYWHTAEQGRSDEGRLKIRDFAEYVGEGTEAIIVSLQVPILGSDPDGESARGACFVTLLEALASGAHCDRIELAIFEERRHQRQRSADERTLKEGRGAGRIPRTMRVLSASPATDHLLWLPDLASYALYQRQLGRQFQLSNPFIDRVRTLEVAP